MFKKILETVEVYNELLFGKAITKRKLNTIEKCAGFRKAFTLAEVLITLGVIGVVAALTLPTLIQNHQKQTYVTGLKKAYSTLSNAYSKMAVDEGITDWQDLSCTNNYECFNDLNKVVKVIELGVADSNATSKFKMFQKFATTGDPYFLTADSQLFRYSCGGTFDVDINANKGPNQFGRDIFRFNINFQKNKIEPNGLQQNSNADVPFEYIWEFCNSNNVSLDCTAKVLIEGKMNY